jgi:hypothetical protein
MGTRKGGRQKGTPNKDSLAILAIFEELDYCPAVEAVKLIKSGTLEPEVAMNAHLKLMKFKFPERKAVEHKLDDKTTKSIEETIMELNKGKA